MTTELTTVQFQVSQIEVEKSGIDATTFIRGLARRKAVEAKKSLMMIERRFDEGAKMHHAIAYLKES